VADQIWDGILRGAPLSEGARQSRHALADAARDGDWPTALALLRENGGLVNATRPDGTSLYAPLHQAAHGGAPAETVAALLELGAWRTLTNARGERPVDVAERRGHGFLLAGLRPVLKRRVPAGVLLRIQGLFHEVIRGRVEGFGLAEGTLRLPELAPLLEVEAATVWFAVPGMYGGFSYRLEADDSEAELVCESWSRVVGGSGQRHAIDPGGARLIAEGFV
jgi:hypothetical protein